MGNSNGILNFAPKRGEGVLALGNPIGDNAMLGYLAGALQGGNLGQSIGRGLEGFVAGARLDQQRLAGDQTYAALAAAGIPEPLAKAAALNRDVMKAVMPAYVGGAAQAGATEDAARAPEQTRAHVSDAARPFDTAAVSALNDVIGQLEHLAGVGTPEAGAATAAAPTQALRASGVGEDELRAFADMLAGARAPDARKAAVGRGLDLVQSRLADLQGRYPRRTGTAPPELLSPRAKARLEKLRQWSAGASNDTAGERAGASSAPTN